MNSDFNITLVEIFDNEPRVSHRVIAEQTSNLERSISKLITTHYTKFELFGKVRFEIASIKNSKNRVNEEKTYFLNEPQATLLLTFMRNNEIVISFKVTLVKEFYKMRELLQNQNFSENPKNEILQLEKEMIGLKTAIEILRPSEASKIGMTKTHFTDLGLKTSYLPEYSDEEHTYSAKALLEKFEIQISVQQFNKKMISAGFLETKTRKSSKYKTEKDEDGKEVKIPILKEFKSLTEKGLEFGKNMISPKNQLESQPHYFENSFSELLKLLKI
ncbi:Phage regulatory protein Rha (Phage_pRha) [Thiovulum sp. ES]|nr:Phage regulatory protein Rha (Phage_pRha) [Thiovulum sp. ES]